MNLFSNRLLADNFYTFDYYAYYQKASNLYEMGVYKSAIHEQ